MLNDSPHGGRCLTCKFASVEDDRREGICRKNPPIVVGVGTLLVLTKWPEVNPLIDWCGAYEQR